MSDPLRNRSAAVALAVVLAFVFGIAIRESIGFGAPDQLPGVALDSPALLHIFRATVATALVAALLVILIRGAFGYWPLQISTTGVAYTEVVISESELAEQVRDVVAAARELDARLSAVEASKS
jgi:predicted secreted protein